MTKDLTTGKPGTVLWRFCIPLFGSILFQQLYNIADSWVAGKFINQNALAAVGNSYEITLIFLAFAFGCNIGCSVIVSQLFGARDYGRMKTAVFTAMISSGILCVVLMGLGMISCDRLLEAINTPDIILADSKLYLDIYIWGLPFVLFYNLSTGIFSALGDSKTPFLFLAISSLTNIGMDILFVTTLNMGVAGVAWATFLCQGASCITAVAVVFLRLRRIPSREKPAWFSKTIFKRFALIAIPSILQQSFISIGNIVIQGIINGFGADVTAGYSASVKLNNLVITSFTTLGNGVSNFAAQNIGAGKLKRIQEGFGAGVRMVWIICLPLVVLYFFCGESLVRFFVDEPTKLAIDSGTGFLKILSPFYFVISVKLVADGILRGAGMMKQFMVATFTDLVLRVILAALLSGTALGANGIWCAWPIGWLVGTPLSILFHRRGSWMEERLKSAN